MILDETKLIEFLVTHKNYFKNHVFNDPSIEDFKGLENHTIAKASIRNCGTLIAETIWSDIIEEAEDHIYSIKLAISIPNIQKIGERFMLEHKIEHKYILQQNAYIPKDRDIALKRARWDKLLEERKIRRKMNDCTPITMVINEKSAAVCFPSIKYTADLETVVHSNEKEFVDWCHNYFRAKWEISKQFDEKLIKQLTD